LDETAFFAYVQDRCSAEEYRDLIERTYEPFLPGYWTSRKFTDGLKTKRKKKNVLGAAQRVSSTVTGIFIGLERGQEGAEDAVSNVKTFQ
jgi:hypothetical protein